MNLRSRWEERKREIRGRQGRSIKWLALLLVAVIILYFLISKGVIVIGF